MKPSLATLMHEQLRKKGTIVISRSGEIGLTTGGTRGCQMAGCLGQRIGIRWADGKLTFPCTKGMTTNSDGTWRII